MLYNTISIINNYISKNIYCIEKGCEVLKFNKVIISLLIIIFTVTSTLFITNYASAFTVIHQKVKEESITEGVVHK